MMTVFGSMGSSEIYGYVWDATQQQVQTCPAALQESFALFFASPVSNAHCHHHRCTMLVFRFSLASTMSFLILWSCIFRASKNVTWGTSKKHPHSELAQCGLVILAPKLELAPWFITCPDRVRSAPQASGTFRAPYAWNPRYGKALCPSTTRSSDPVDVALTCPDISGICRKPMSWRDLSTPLRVSCQHSAPQCSWAHRNSPLARPEATWIARIGPTIRSCGVCHGAAGGQKHPWCPGHGLPHQLQPISGKNPCGAHDQIRYIT